MISTDHSIFMEKNPWRYQHFLKAGNKMSDISLISASLSLLHFLEQLMSMFLKIYAKLFLPILCYPFRKEKICQTSRWTSVGEGCWTNTAPAYVWGKGKVEQGEIVPSLQLTKNRIFANHTYPNCSLSQFYLSYYLYDSQGCYLLTIWSWAHFLTFLCLSFFIYEMGIVTVPTFLG